MIPTPAIALLATAATTTTATAPTTVPAALVPIGLVLFIIFVALVFDLLNGFHDAANSIATIVSTRVLSPTMAVAWAAFFNFVAAFVFGTTVAGTIGSGLIHNDAKFLDVYVVLAGLTGAIIWNLVTWWRSEE